jgi:hypothetical protein
MRLLCCYQPSQVHCGGMALLSSSLLRIVLQDARPCSRQARVCYRGTLTSRPVHPVHHQKVETHLSFIFTADLKISLGLSACTEEGNRL